MTTLRLSPTQMTEFWEAYSINKSLRSLDEHSFTGFRLQLIKDSSGLAASSTAGDGAVRSLKKRDLSSAVVTPGHNKRQLHGAPGSAHRDASGNRRVSLSPDPLPKTSALPPSLPSYSERLGAGETLVEFNPCQLQPVESVAPFSKHKCLISNDFATNVESTFRHFFTVLDERATVLDEQLQEKIDEFSVLYNFGSEQIADLEAVGVPRQEAICCIGRICNAVCIFAFIYRRAADHLDGF